MFNFLNSLKGSHPPKLPKQELPQISAKSLFRVEPTKAQNPHLYTIEWELGPAKTLALPSIDFVKKIHQDLGKKNKFLQIHFFLKNPKQAQEYADLFAEVNQLEVPYTLYFEGRGVIQDLVDPRWNPTSISLDLDIQGGWEETLNILKGYSKKVDMSLRLLIYEKNFFEVYSLAARLKELPNVTVELKRVWNKASSPLVEKVVAHQKELFTNKNKRIEETTKLSFHSRNGNINKLSLDEVDELMLNRWKGWKCRAGLNQMFINKKGLVYRSRCYQPDRIGEISSGEWSLPENEVKCPLIYCPNPKDFTIVKTTL